MLDIRGYSLNDNVSFSGFVGKHEILLEVGSETDFELGEIVYTYPTTVADPATYVGSPHGRLKRWYSDSGQYMVVAVMAGGFASNHLKMHHLLLQLPIL